MDDSAQVSETLSDSEFSDALGALGSAALFRLMKIASALADGTEYGPQDLLHEAIVRALDGQRKCRRDLPIVTFLAGAMRSIAWANRQHRESDPLATAHDIDDPNGTTTAIASPAVPTDDLLQQRAAVNEIMGLFEGDEDASQILLGLSEGYSAEEVRDIWGMDKKRYDTTRRRIRRKIEKAFPQGWLK